MTSTTGPTVPATAGADQPPTARWLATPTRYLFFTGKGGVGKTTVASATALRLAERGLRVLIVSTDPASNLDDVVGIAVDTAPTVVPDVPALWVMNIDPEAAAAAARSPCSARGRPLASRSARSRSSSSGRTAYSMRSGSRACCRAECLTSRRRTAPAAARRGRA